MRVSDADKSILDSEGELPGVRIDWVGHPEYDEFIFDWLDEQPIEAQTILLSEPRKRTSPTREACYGRLALHFWAAKEIQPRANIDPLEVKRVRALLQVHFWRLVSALILVVTLP